MKYVKQFCIIALITFIGEVLHKLIPLPIPAGIYGILLLFGALCTKVIKLEQVKDVGDFLVEIMPIMFVPAAVGLMDSWSIIRTNWVAYLVITFVTTFLVMSVAGLVTQKVIRKSQEHHHE